MEDSRVIRLPHEARDPAIIFQEIKIRWLWEDMQRELTRRHWYYRGGETSSFIAGKRWFWQDFSLVGTDGLVVPTHWRIVE
jgi:hypothetical protein